MRDDRQGERDQHGVGHEGQDVPSLDGGLGLLAEIDGDDVARAEPVELGRQVDEVLRLRQPDRGRREQHQRDQRHHEGRHAHAGNEHAVDEADQRAGGEHDDHRHRDGGAVAGKNAAAFVDQVAPQRAAAEQRGIDGRRHDDRAEHADEPHDGALRQVDAADDDDECLADGDGQQRPDVGELVAEIAGAGEIGEEDRHDDEIGGGQIEDEVLGKQQAARHAGKPARRRPLAGHLRPTREAALENRLICHGRFPRATASSRQIRGRAGVERIPARPADRNPTSRRGPCSPRCWRP